MEHDEDAAVISSDALSAVVPSSSTSQVEPINRTDAAAKTSSHPLETTAESGLDFIGPSHAVKDLFSAPYAGDVNVAIHNVDGMLLIDAAADPERMSAQVAASAAQHEPLERSFFQIPPSKEKNNAQEHQQQLIALPEQNDALATITALLRDKQVQSHNIVAQQDEITNDAETSQDEKLAHNNPLLLPPPEHYAGTVVPHEPHEYLSWQFQNMNLLVGSDALVCRPSPAPGEAPSKSQAVTVRVADASDMRLKLQQYQEAVTREKKSYADVLAPQPPSQPDHAAKNDVTVASPDSTMLRLQSCIVPSGNVIEGGMVPTDPAATTPSASNTICTVMDAYLDNIIANVPQLALCLYEQGFIQSVKLMQTHDIPSNLMHPATLNMTSSSSATGDEPIFSPHVMEMNASMLLRFLRSNCTRNNATYLLRRQEGETNIKLYDISSLSAQRQRKWIWWLAMMSYRFAVRLGQLTSTSRFHASENRSFRARQRSLLQNALELLQELNDRDGPAHETICAAVCEHLADTFLSHPSDQEDDDESSIHEDPKQTSLLSSQPYSNVSGDALNKAQDHLVTGIKTLWPLFEKSRQTKKKTSRNKPRSTKHKESSSGRRVVVVVHGEGSSSSSSGSDDDTDDDDKVAASPTEPMSMEKEAVTTQLLGLHHKLINVNLRLAEHHLRNYWSSSAMQALRSAARRIAVAAALLRPLDSSRSKLGIDKSQRESPPVFIDRLRQSMMLQYVWLWERCGFFARSFAADELWRDRGHCCGDDIISLLRDVEAAFSTSDRKNGKTAETWLSREAPISKKTNHQATLHSLSAVVSILNPQSKHNSNHTTVVCDPEGVEVAKAILDQQKQIKRDERRVLVAACVSYSRAIGTFQNIDTTHDTATSGVSRNDVSEGNTPDMLGDGAAALDADSNVLSLLRQRFGDACNELGKMLLRELRTVLATPETKHTEGQDSSVSAAFAFLSSAQFWFLEGLHCFKECKDLRNVALLRCNLCQCCKLRANNMFLNKGLPSRASSGGTHAENSLQDAADHLQMAHESLGQREVDPMTWDMVSEELAATFLVLGVRRRQSLLGRGSTPLVIEAMRLNPGMERSVVDPMERSLDIYKQSGNAHQAAAVHYQLAQFYSKVWTCQRDEAKTRAKLSAAFEHYSAAHAYFSKAPRGEEPTFCILSLDLANLYAAVAGHECLAKALDRCLDTADAFSREAADAARERGVAFASDWLDRMITLASSIEDRVFKLLLSLVKLEKDFSSSNSEFKELYRVALTAKATLNNANESGEEKENRLYNVHDLLTMIREKRHQTRTQQPL